MQRLRKQQDDEERLGEESSSSSSSSSGGLSRQDTMLELAKSFSTVTDASNGDGDSTLSTTTEDDDPLLLQVVTEGGTAPDESTKRKKELDVAKYFAARAMTPFQERMNAITILPNPIYCAYYILAGHWISQELVEEYQESDLGFTVDDSLCILSSYVPSFHAMPPWTVLAVFLGITLHAPWSFLYHWKYAHELPPTTRGSHWSRRMDHSMIHVASTFLSFATSGSYQYTMANILFNADCVYRQFLPRVRPRANQVRVAISMLAYTIPVLNRGELALYAKILAVVFLSGWFFITYPVKGWSHSVFHLVICFLPPLLMEAATSLPSSVEYNKIAAQCVVMAERSVSG